MKIQAVAFSVVVCAATLAPLSRAAAQQARATCEIMAREQGLKGKAFKTSVKQCFSQQKPTLATIDHCRKAGQAAGLDKHELPTFVRSCLYGHGD